MKIRQGFVSNSSSSSFVISYDPDLVISPADLRYKMFGTQYEVDFHGDTIRTMDIAHILFNLLMPNNSNDDNIVYAMSEEMVSMEKHDMMLDAFKDENNPNYLTEFYDAWDEYLVILREKAKKALIERRELNPDKLIVACEISDNDGRAYSYLEHTGVIERTFDKTIKVSHH